MILEHYIKNYNYSFKEKPFNEVDNLVLSTLVYLNYSKFLSEGKVSLSRLADIYLAVNPKLPKNSPFAYKDAYKLLKLVKDNERYKDILVYNYEYSSADDYQFGAITYEFGQNLFIAFDGTDDLISGWEEDFRMSYMFPVTAHKKAIKYLSKYTFGNKRIYLGGHSKGGNLALVAAMYTNVYVRTRIKKIYSNDGPGLRKKEFNSLRYKIVKKRFVHFIPQNSIVGLLFKHENDIVVKSRLPILFSHTPSSWKVDVDKFERDELIDTCEYFDINFAKWLDKYEDSEKKKFIDEIFGILKEHGIDTISDIKEDLRYIFKIIKSSRKMSKEAKLMLNDLIDMMKNEK